MSRPIALAAMMHSWGEHHYAASAAAFDEVVVHRGIPALEDANGDPQVARYRTYPVRQHGRRQYEGLGALQAG